MRILIAEDDYDSRVLLQRILEKDNHQVLAVENGRQAWECFQREEIGLVITDWQMPELGGLELCKNIRGAGGNGYVYIILVTAREAKQDLIQAMDAGANDYVTKPYDKGELLARVRAGTRILELQQQLGEKHQQLLAAQQQSEELLQALLPRSIVDRLKQQPQVIADSFSEATVLFADIHNFTALASQKEPIALVELLNQVFSAFDRLAERFGLEKIKTVGDGYMLAAGVPEPRPDHAEAVAEMALAMQQEIFQLDSGTAEPLQLRIGIDSGPLIAGVIGTARLAYDLWGGPVSTAEQMKTYGLPGGIQVSAATWERLRRSYLLEERGEFYVPGSGVIKTFLLTGRREEQP